ncbi:ABC transporter ATP-binding protein [Microbacterium marinilacus]|uniref:ABC transporter ATP-binding protein n=1 Tax=Microbacterium marinilacus TaxID=415209 RepID=A0ABP7BHF7_9MICO|nr:ABC transporter ATP-binding protein [Microbacterium marinilacus]MBY0687591.1 ABC transporter ATP-binding protein/permease [Microbacterium marinilacus]
MSPNTLLRPVRAPLIAAVALQAAAGLLALLPLLTLIAFTSTWLTRTPAPGAGLVIAAVLGTIGATLAAAAATWITHRADARLTWLLQRRLADVIRHAPLPAVTGQGAARLRKVVQDDTGALHYLVAHTLLDATTLLITPVAGLVVLAIVDWRLAVVSLIPLLLGVRWYVRAMRGSGANFTEYAIQQQRIGGAVVDFVHGLPVAKIYGGSDGPKARYTTAVNGFHDFFRAWSGSTAAVTTASWLVVAPGVTAALLALLGGAGLLAGWLTPAALVAGILLGPAISAPVAVAGPRLQAIRSGLSALSSIGDLLDQHRLTWGGADPSPRGAVARLQNVTVRFGEQVAVDDVTLALPDRGLVALVGASGSGKSTLAALLARFTDPDAGRVLLGNVELPALREADLYERIAFVFQDTALRETSIRDALTGGRRIPQERVVDAARQAAIHDHITALPHGYDTILGEDRELSGGQRQRVALARALLREPDLLVLDETLSAMDPTIRTRIMATLRAQARERGVLLIAHHLHLVRDADRILVLDHGRLAGSGTHHNLLTACDPYRILWEAQTTTTQEGSR